MADEVSQAEWNWLKRLSRREYLGYTNESLDALLAAGLVEEGEITPKLRRWQLTDKGSALIEDGRSFENVRDWRRLERPDDYRQARRWLGLTQAQMADALELSGGDFAKDKVRFIESGKRPATGPIRACYRLMLERAGLL